MCDVVSNGRNLLADQVAAMYHAKVETDVGYVKATPQIVFDILHEVGVVIFALTLLIAVDRPPDAELVLMLKFRVGNVQ